MLSSFQARDCRRCSRVCVCVCVCVCEATLVRCENYTRNLSLSSPRGGWCLCVCVCVCVGEATLESSETIRESIICPRREVAVMQEY